MKLEQLFTKTEKQTIWALIETQKKKKIILKERKQKYLDTLRSWGTP